MPPTHVSRFSRQVIDWLEEASKPGSGVECPETWSVTDRLDERTWLACLTALNLSVQRNQPVLLVTTLLTEFETVRKLILDETWVTPGRLSQGDLSGEDFQDITRAIQRIQATALHIWHPAADELQNHEMFRPALRLASLRSGATTVVIDSVHHLPALLIPKSLEMVRRLTCAWKIEILVQHKPRSQQAPPIIE